MKKGISAAAILAFAIALFYISCSRPQPAAENNEPAAHVPISSPASNAPAQKPAAPSISTTITPNDPSAPVTNVADRAGEMPPTAPAPRWPAEVVVENVSHALHQYREMFGSNPVGTNEEITQALNGNNPKKITFVDAQTGMRVNVKGELVDPWDTPLFFHQLSGTDTEVRSAGPDKQMWTVDDVVSR